MSFNLKSDYQPAGDQPKAIDLLVNGIEFGRNQQILLGVTGSGKTFTTANVITRLNLPTLVIAHNKTLAAQLTQEFRTFFPDNAVEYFVSYYDYYQPEAYLAGTDTYIEKEADINDEIDRLRHRATSALLTRKDVIVVASVSAIYGLGSPDEYQKTVLILSQGQEIGREELISSLIDMHYVRSSSFERGTFNAKGNLIEIVPIGEERLYRIKLNGNSIQSIQVLELVTRSLLEETKTLTVFPAKHFVTSPEKMNKALKSIKNELDDRLKVLNKAGKNLEADRLERRTKYDLAMMKEVGYTNGIENYSRHLTGRKPGEPPYTLIDYFPEGFLTVIDESHVTVPQIGGMYAGDRARKDALIDFGFRLPSAYDNRPLKFNEFEAKLGPVIYLSATPGPYEKKHSQQLVEQIIRPTGLIDPQTDIRPIEGQVQDAIKEIEKETDLGHRVLVTTLTKKMAEDLAEHLQKEGVKSTYLHSEVDTIERIRTLDNLRLGKTEVLVGVNLLREGLDLPEVSMVLILDADKEGFLRSETSLVQTIGRAARNVRGRVILYADQVTGSMHRALAETDRRRKIQLDYNQKHNITPQTIKKEIESIIPQEEQLAEEWEKAIDINKLPNLIKDREKEMKRLAKELRFEEAALARDEAIQLRKMQRTLKLK
ncbi:excinuclease ABC subunit UvrB [Candidatus Berkelbacteria bacterium]|nr:excinuclease ABC subunit UvrB [Candidatus Berkelbacteria bacterium]